MTSNFIGLLVIFVKFFIVATTEACQDAAYVVSLGKLRYMFPPFVAFSTLVSVPFK